MGLINATILGITSYEEIRDRVYLRLSSQKLVDENIAGIYAQPFMDLYITYWVDYGKDDRKRPFGYPIDVDTDFFERLHINKDEIFRDALRNTMEMCRADYGPAAMMHRNLFSTYFLLDIPEMMMIRPECGYASSCLLYPGICDEIAEYFHSDFYILPYSCLEVGFWPKKKDEDESSTIAFLKDRILQLLDHLFYPDTPLSLHIWYYDAEKKELRDTGEVIEWEDTFHPARKVKSE